MSCPPEPVEGQGSQRRNSLITNIVSMAAGDDWNDRESTLLVADYLQMLYKELKGIPFVKMDHTRSLMPLLPGRTKGSLEKKRMNVSAVLIEHRLPTIIGYKPYFHRQTGNFENIVIDQFEKHQGLSEVLNNWTTNLNKVEVGSVDYSKVLEKKLRVTEFGEKDTTPNFKPVKRDYLAEEERNTAVGEKGEKFVHDYERWWLKQHGREDLAKKVLWASKEIGDGIGYDIRSKSLDGTDKFIEVKTTTQGLYVPFYFTSNELKFSVQQQNKYSLYRVFALKKNPKIYISNGALDTLCNYSARSYKGWFSK
jgi:hypothetical protein